MTTYPDDYDKLSNAEFRRITVQIVRELQGQVQYEPTPTSRQQDFDQIKRVVEWSNTQPSDVKEGTIVHDNGNGYVLVRRMRGNELMKVEYYAEIYPEQSKAYFGTRSTEPTEVKDE